MVNNKKIAVFTMIMILVLVNFAGCAGNNGNVEGTTELNLAHFFPSSHPVETELIQPWSEAIEEATDGQVKITSYPNETLGQSDAIYEGVVTGISEMGLSCFSYTRGRFPVLEAFELPGVNYRTSQAASRVAWEGIQTLNPEEIQDTKLMMVFATGPGDLFTTVPVETLEDLQGLDVRATGLSAQTLETLGAVPSAMPQADTYEALSKGVVQGNLSPVEVLQGWRHAEVTDYLTLTPFIYNTLFFITMNIDEWNALSPEIQETIEEINEKFFDEVAAGLWDMQNDEAIEWAVEEMGQEVIELSEEEANKWIELIQPIQDDFIDKMDKNGFDGEEIMDTVKDLADKYDQLF